MSIKSPFSSSVSGAMDWGRKTPTVAYLATSSTALQTVVDATGEGVASIGLVNSLGTPAGARAVITVDGSVLSDITSTRLAIGLAEGNNAYGMMAPGAYGSTAYGGTSGWSGHCKSTGGTGKAGLSVVPWIGFKDSFKFEILKTTGVSPLKAGAVVLS